MPRRNWKRVTVTSLRHAMELCLEHAREKHNHNVDRIADLMGLANKWNLYKWLESGRMPASLIRPFESACGIMLVTRYLAHSSDFLIIEIPTGRKATAKQINALQGSLNEAFGHLIRFVEGESSAEETAASLVSAMEDLAFHKRNVEKANQPELDFGKGE